LPVTAAWEQKPTKATIARRPFFTSFKVVLDDFMLRGSKGKEFKNPDCGDATNEIREYQQRNRMWSKENVRLVL
jgi:hypothetical protein